MQTSHQEAHLERPTEPEQPGIADAVKHRPFLSEAWYLTRKQVVQLTGLSRDTIDRMEHRGDFPQRIHLSRRKIGWDVQEITAWHRKRKAARGAPRAPTHDEIHRPKTS